MFVGSPDNPATPTEEKRQPFSALATMKPYQ